MVQVLFTADPTAVTDDPRLIASGSERHCRREAAWALGADTLRGLKQAATHAGVRYYAPGADDYDGASVELVWTGDEDESEVL